MAANNKINDTVTVTFKQKNATKTLNAVTGISKALEEVELNAINASDTLDEVFDIKSLAAYEAKVDSIAKSMSKLNAGSGLSREFQIVQDLLEDIANNTEGTKNNTRITATHLGEMAHDSDILARNSDEAADGFRETAKYTGKTAEELKTARKEQEKFNKEQAKQIKRQKQGEGLTGMGSSRNQGKAASKMLSNAGALTAAYAMVYANVYAVTEVFRQLSVAASDARLLEVTDTLSAAKGANVEVAAAAMRDVLEGSLSVQESMRLATASISKGFTTDQLAELTLVARRASVALGLDLTDAMNRVTKGIAKQEIELLDELGITIKLTEAFDAYALKLGVAADNLSSAQRQQALYNLVTEKSAETLGSIDGVMKATEWEKFGARASSAINKIAQSATESGSMLSNILAGINGYLEGTDLSGIDKKISALTNTNVVAFDAKDLAPGIKAGLALKEALSLESLEEDYSKVGKQIHAITEEMVLLQGEIESSDWKRNAVDAAKGAALGFRIEGMKEQREALMAEAEAIKYYVERTRKIEANPNTVRGGGLNATTGGLDLESLRSLSELLDNVSMSSLGAKDNLDLFTKGTLKASDTQPLDNTISTGNKLLDYLQDIRERAAAIGQEAKGDETISAALKASNLGETEEEVRNYLDTLTTYQQSLIEITKVEQRNAEAVANAKNAYADLNSVQTNSYDSLEKYADSIAIRNIEATIQAQEKAWIAEKAILRDKTVIAAKEIEFNTNRAKSEAQLTSLVITRTKAEHSLAVARRATLQAESVAAQQALIRDGGATQQVQADFGVTNATVGLINAEEALRTARVDFAQEGSLANAIAIQTAQQSLTQAKTVLAEAKEVSDNVGVLQTETIQNNAVGVHGGNINVGTAMGSTTPNAGEQEQQNLALDTANMAAATEAMSSLMAYTPGLDAMASGLSNLASVALTFGDSMQSGTAMAIAGLQAMGGMMQMVSQGAVSEIDHQIDMEKKRDGSSKESLAKIKQLEAEKIKEQQKSARQQIIISTAISVANALATPPFPLGLALAGTAVVAGALALSQVNSATSNSLESLNTSPDTSSVSSIAVGDRDSSVDLAKSASGGEYGYLTGESGTGSANNFVPRSTGGSSSANTSLVLGENGPEIVSFPQAASITANEDIGESKSGSSNNYYVTIQTMDSQSFLDKSEDIFLAFEREASQQGLDVDKLRE